MSATIFGASRFGLADDSTATGLLLGSVNYNYTTEQSFAKNHVGNDVSFSVYNDAADVSCDGVVATKSAGLGFTLADALTLANTSVDTQDVLNDRMASGTAGGLVITGGNLTRSNTEFETGSISAIYRPLVANGSPTVVS